MSFTKILADGSEVDEATTHVAVRDNTTGLIWSVLETKPMTHAAAVKHVGKLELLGHKDWRLPTIQELLGLVDYDRYGPALDEGAFPRCKSDWYWTSTPAAYSPDDCAWLVHFHYGDSLWDRHGPQYYVRAVRASQ